MVCVSMQRNRDGGGNNFQSFFGLHTDTARGRIVFTSHYSPLYLSSEIYFVDHAFQFHLSPFPQRIKLQGRKGNTALKAEPPKAFKREGPGNVPLKQKDCHWG